MPRSPGFSGTYRSINPPRIYAAIDETRRQLEVIPKPRLPFAAICPRG